MDQHRGLFTAARVEALAAGLFALSGSDGEWEQLDDAALAEQDEAGPDPAGRPER